MGAARSASMSVATAAAAAMVKHFGFGKCETCFTRKEQMCPDPWLHMATAVCHSCEATRESCSEHAHECPAAAIARVSASCKTTAAQRNPKEVQERAQTAQALKEQFDVETMQDIPRPEDYELLEAYDFDM